VVAPPPRKVYAARRVSVSVLQGCSQRTALQDLGAVLPPVPQDCRAPVLRAYTPPKRSRLVRGVSAFWMQTTGAPLLVVKRCSVMRAWMPAQDSRSAHGLLYLAAVRSDRHHLIRRLCHAHPLPAHFTADLP
jgi:hypothetical protein